MSVSSNNPRRSPLRAAWAQRWISLAFVFALAVAAIVLAGYAAPGRSASASPALQETATPTLAPGTGALVGVVWIDSDTDGIRDPGEAPLPNALIDAANSVTGVKASATTGADGKYRINNLPPGIYHVTGTPPPSYILTTAASYDVAMAAGALVALDFGAWSPPTPTPSPTSPPVLDPTDAQRVYCGGVYSGDTTQSQNNVSAYSCAPWWDESGNEQVFRLQLAASQPVTVTLLSASADLDLFLLRYVYPDSCLAAGDTYFSYAAEPGAYFLSVDGYRGANGSYSFRVDCPLDERATPTPTLTPSPTPTSTPTGPVTETPTASPTATRGGPRVYLPLVVRAAQGPTGPSVTLTLQDGLYGYAGTTDSTLDSWAPAQPSGSDNRLRLTYARAPKLAEQKSPVLKFDLSLLPAGAEVRSAALRLYLPSAPAYDVRVAAHGLLRAWEEATVTWNEASAGQAWNAQGASAEGLDRTAWASNAQQLVAGARWYEFDVTALAREWARVPAGNHGMLLTATAGDSDASVEARFTSREGSLASRPQFIISYTLPATLAQ